ncbi:MAG: hypothetical protein CSA34_05760 [Desulfobulbus propionicus]|nr:MAG: hypothetical protein CSA34_05760 [Desulfobulbus propionicus]
MWTDVGRTYILFTLGVSFLNLAREFEFLLCYQYVGKNLFPWRAFGKKIRDNTRVENQMLTRSGQRLAHRDHQVIKTFSA